MEKEESQESMPFICLKKASRCSTRLPMELFPVLKVEGDQRGRDHTTLREKGKHDPMYLAQG
jgi:hypothetical protein